MYTPVHLQGEQPEPQAQKNRPEPVWGALVVMILAVQRPIGCPGVAACIKVPATIGGVAIERPMGSADQSWPIDRPGRSMCNCI